jgi:hypothetical protein
MFAYDDALIEQYPTIRAGVIHATGLANGPSSTQLLDDYRAEHQAASQRLSLDPPSKRAGCSGVIMKRVL